MDFIPVCEPLLEGNELKYIHDAVSTNWISSSGSYVSKFESEFAKFCGSKYAVTTTSGTTALHLACAALGLAHKDEVIIPNFTMIASAFAICYTGAKPVFVDSDSKTWNIDVTKIEEKITDKTKAIMPVHIFGNPCDMNPIIEIAKKYNLKVIEDSAEAHGSKYNGRKCGVISDLGCFSLFANKIITTGEGGIIVTNNPDLYDRCKYLKNLSFPLEGDREYIHDEIGFNYRMPNTLAALGLAQLEKINYYIEKRISNAKLYDLFLKDIPGIIFQQQLPDVRNVHWMYGVVVEEEFGISRDDLMSKLKKHKIDSRRFFYPMHRQPSLNKIGCDCTDEYLVSDYLSKRGLYLPSGSGLKKEQIDYICSAIASIQN